MEEILTDSSDNNYIDLFLFMKKKIHPKIYKIYKQRSLGLEYEELMEH